MTEGRTTRRNWWAIAGWTIAAAFGVGCWWAAIWAAIEVVL